jgi:rSAM/selenodomain-associated transferase 1
MQKNLLIVFVKNPELGRCKTRLAATVGDEKALTFYKNMLKHTRHVVTNAEAHKYVFYSSFIDTDDLWPQNESLSKHLQSKGDLGNKMHKAFEQGFADGYENICIIGSDCYALDAQMINKAFETLQNNKAVIGPSTDGGYYLLGMSQMIPEVFQNKQWSTETVTADTEADLKQLNYSYEKLPALTDIDNEEDLNTIDADVVEKLFEA